MTSASFKLEFWWDCNGVQRRRRARYYSTAEGMLRAGKRWEDKSPVNYCRYWNGLNTWVSESHKTEAV